MLEWIITSSVLIILTLLVRSLLKGHMSLRLQYGLWLVVLIRLLLPVQLGSSPVSVLTLQPEQQTAVTQQIPAGSQSQQLPNASDPAVLPEAPAVQEGINAEQTLIGQESTRQQTVPAQKAAVSLKQIAMWVWLAGMVVMSAVFAVSGLLFRARLRRTSERMVAPESPLPVFVSPLIRTPCLYGLFSPRIYLHSRLSEPQRIHILTHELTHYRHCDHMWAFLRMLCLILHWYNPLVWLAAVVSRRDAELACDEAAVHALGEQCREAYGKTLIDMTCVKTDARTLFLSATTMTAGKRTLWERIRLLGKHPKTKRITLIFVVVLVLAAVGCTFTDAPEPKETAAATSVNGVQPPRYDDGGLEACYLYVDGAIYVWDYAAPETVPTAGNAKRIGTVQKNDIFAVPQENFSACRLEVGTELYRDNLYRGTLYCAPGPQGSDAPYGTFVLAHKIDQWWEQSPRKYGLYKHTQLGYVEYIYLQKEQATLILSQELRLPITISGDSIAAYGMPMTKFRTYGDELCLYIPGDDLAYRHYTYVGPQDITLKKSAVPEAGSYRLQSVYEAPGQTGKVLAMGAQITGGLVLHDDGTGTLTYAEQSYPVLWGSNGLYIGQGSDLSGENGYVQGTFDPSSKTLVIFHNGVLMYFSMSEQPQTSPSGKALSEEQMETFAALFQFESEDSVNVWYNFALNSAFESPEDVDLLELFYSAPWQTPELTEQELQLLEAEDMNWQASEVHVYSEQMMDSVLRQYFGVALEQTNGIGLDKMLHNAQMGRYYHLHEDYKIARVSFLQGLQETDGTYVLYYYHVTEPTSIWQVRLIDSDSGYKIMSNTLVG